MIGTKLGRYEILAKLGAGGMGEVYRARDLSLGREIALKILPESVRNDRERLRRFEQEARSASALNHPNIITIHEIGETGGIPYISMELVTGKTLRALMVEGPLPIKRTLAIACGLAEGLAKAHAAGIIHRDLKPENLMLTDDGFLKILDFGLAKLHDLDPALPDAPTDTGTRPGVLLGTVGYMSPELVRGLPVDFRSDQFACGAILYEMATGRRAFWKETSAQTIVAILESEPEPVANINPEAPAPLRWIVERCLKKDPSERYASTLDFARELRNVHDRLAHVSAGSASSAQSQSVLGRRSRVAAAAVVFVVLVLLAWRLDFLWPRSGRPPTRNAGAYADYLQARAFLERSDVPDNVDRAIAIFERAIAKESAFALAHAGLGEAYWRKFARGKDPTWAARATTSTLEALRLDPGQPAVYVALARLHEGTGNKDAAIDALRKGLRLNDDLDDAHRLLGEILVDRGKRAEGIAELRRAVDLRPSNWRNHHMLGIAYYTTGELDKAIATFTRVTELQPDSAVGFQTLGTALHASGRTAEATAAYETAIRLGPSANSYSNLGTIHYDEGRFEEAAQAYQKASELDAKNPVKYRNHGDALARLARIDEARTKYEQARSLAEAALQMNPKDGRMLALQALCEAKLGRAAEAEAHSQQAVNLMPSDNHVQFHRAAVLALTGRAQESMKSLRRALALGFPQVTAGKDYDLVSLHGRPDWRALFLKKS